MMINNLIELGRKYFIKMESYRLRAYSYFQLHKDEIRQKQRN